MSRVWFMLQTTEQVQSTIRFVFASFNMIVTYMGLLSICLEGFDRVRKSFGMLDWSQVMVMDQSWIYNNNNILNTVGIELFGLV